MVKGWLKEKGHYYYLEDGKMLANTTVTLDGRSFSFNEYGVCTSDTSNLNFTEANTQNNNSNSNNSQGPGAAGPGVTGPGGNSSTESNTSPNPNANQSSSDGPSAQGPSGTSPNASSGETIQPGSTTGPQ